MTDEDCDLTLLYWIQKLHRCPYKQRNIAGATKCTTKPLSKMLTYILQLSKRVSRNIIIPAFLEVVLIKCGIKKLIRFVGN